MSLAVYVSAFSKQLCAWVRYQRLQNNLSRVGMGIYDIHLCSLAQSVGRCSLLCLGGDPHPGAPSEAGSRRHGKRGPDARHVHVPKSHLHHVRVAFDELVWTHQKEQIPGAMWRDHKNDVSTVVVTAGLSSVRLHTKVSFFSAVKSYFCH